MKYFILVLTLFALSLPLTAQDLSKSIKMADFDRSMEGFSFSKGSLVKINPSADGFPMDVDFIFDMPHGLGMNNSELTKWFQGSAGIVDLGEIAPDTKIEKTEEGFISSLEPDMIVPGHTYLIKTADEEHFGTIYIVNFDQDQELLDFTWEYTEE